MAERVHIPSSPACGEWETLLADALDGLLKPEDEARFEAHKAVCPACTALYEEARKGREWLEFLSPEPEAPEGLLEKILAHTGPGKTVPARWTAGGPLPVAAGSASVPDFMPPVWQQPGFLARMRVLAQPRLLMTAAMAFFSIALTLNMTGVRLTGIRLSDLRPAAVRSYMERQLTMASVPIVRYYDHLRFVYEVKSKVRELRGEGEGSGEPRREETQPAAPGETKQNPGKVPGSNDGGLRQDPRQEPNNLVTAPEADPASASGDFVEASLHREGIQSSSDNTRIEHLSRKVRSVQSGGLSPQRLEATVANLGSAVHAWEGSGVWIA
ncbi:MAG: anti-sigma factor family protein [Terracidiphilus sp.]